MKNFVLSLFFLLAPLFVSGAGESVFSSYQLNKYLSLDNIGQEKSRKVINIYVVANGEECSIKGSITIDNGETSVTVTIDVTASNCAEAVRFVTNSLNSISAKFD